MNDGTQTIQSKLMERSHAPEIGMVEKAFVLFVLMSRPSFAAQKVIRLSTACMMSGEAPRIMMSSVNSRSAIQTDGLSWTPG